MKRFYSIGAAVLIVSVSIITWCCTKPTKDFVVNISSNIINYKATVQFVDAQTGAVPAGLAVALDGTNAAVIYDYSGTKQLQVSSAGLLTVGVDPKFDPTSNSLSFNLKSSAANYLAVNTPVTFTSGSNNQNFVVSMINLNNTPAGVKVVQPTASISAGTVTTPITAATTTDANTSVTASITVPTGTQLRDANNTVINGSTVNVVVAAFDPAQQKAMQAFPGGQVQYNVQGVSGGQVFFLPAGFATINMSVNNTEVRNFSTLVPVEIALNPNTFNPSTNALVKAGDALNVYSYQVQTGLWQFEKTATAATVGGKLVASFTTNHLTTFAVCVPSGTVTPCSTAPYLVFNAPGISNESSDVFIVDVYPSGLGNNPAPIFSQYFAIHDKDSIQLKNLPSGNVSVTVSRVDYDHYLLSDYKNRGASVGTASLNLCTAGSSTMNISYVGANYLKGTGYAVCPNDNSKRYLPPNDAEVYYKKSGTNDQLRILGLIVNSAVTTTLLTPGQRYDLFGNYGGKQVGRKNVLIQTGVSFLDSVHIINNGSSFCP
ncbi:hypothetical protein [Filimonas effusa]|uniref:Uncharacterized protein n=1 Tax=Filimonas effusa TaxID=2508721 RepID=A0A4Q1DEI9_9BACT|nr:hypothetical protein [Filimonas effusa]RXK87335.1 hypothetical protein ESB13_11315 [Filimonas effusa]